MSDPMGKRALFSAVEPPRAPNGAPAATMKKEALFTASEGGRRFGTVVVECSACGARSRLGWGEFAWRHLPVWLWVPWVRYSRFISCPACDRRTWLAVNWFA
ncbi:MAG: hypothetical protein AB1679_10230 [Actinomycetota bacterium]|jgi:hypothetical protein